MKTNFRLIVMCALFLSTLPVLSFDFSYKGVNFNCKVKGKQIVITGFDRKAAEVVIPAQVVYKGETYAVKRVNTFVNGDNYSARSLVLEEGIQCVDNFAFIEFRQLQKVTLPATINSIGRKAFRNNTGLTFTLPEGIDENALRQGNSISVSQKKPLKDKELADKTKLQQKTKAKALPDSPSQKLVDEFLSDVDRDIPIAKKQNTNTFCVIIANENYEAPTPKVEYALRDGKLMREYAEKTLGLPAKNIKMYTDATGGVIRRALGWLETIQTYNSNAQLILYYAGHGMPSESDQTAYIVPTDGWTRDVPGTCISLKDVYQKLGNIKSKNIVVLIDACFSGMQRGKDLAVLPARGVAMSTKKEPLSGNVVVLSAASGNETAMAYNEQQHGLFTYFLLRKLKETNGSISLGELFDYIEKEVQQESHLTYEKLQTPTHSEAPAIKDTWKDIRFFNNK